MEPNSRLRAELKAELENGELSTLLESPVFIFLLTLALANTVTIDTIGEPSTQVALAVGVGDNIEKNYRQPINRHFSNYR